MSSATAETEIGRLRDELRQSLDRETNVRAQARKAVKDTQEKLQAEMTAHKRTMESLTKHIDTVSGLSAPDRCVSRVGTAEVLD